MQVSSIFSNGGHGGGHGCCNDCHGGGGYRNRSYGRSYFRHDDFYERGFRRHRGREREREGLIDIDIL